MAGKLLDYNQMVETALRGAVREALKRAAEFGLPGNHHFYITFRTDQPGVEMPDYLRERYADEMTIVLQHQFWGLEPGETAFNVTLSFNKVPERLTVPYAAITAFADPSVQFGLQFRVQPGPAAQAAAMARAVPAQDGAEEPKAKDGEGGAAATAAPKTPATGEIVTLDAFRKKKT